MAEDKIVFFGEVDLNKDGKITSDMPAWYMRAHIEELEQNIVRKESMLKRGGFEQDQIPVIKAEIEADRDKLKKIENSRPKLAGKNKDRVVRAYESLGKQIGESMPTRKETKDGLVSPYDEMKRLKEKHIKISPELAAACGCKPVQGKITGDEANKCYQIMGRALGENTNVERLRRDTGVESYKTENEYLKKILDEQFRKK